MSRILLADDSPHAQRMGERILRDEGFEVVTVTDGESAIIRLADFDPDLIVADAFLPQKSGYEICQFVRNDPRFRHTRIVLTAGAMEALDEEEARRAGVDATLKKFKEEYLAYVNKGVGLTAQPLRLDISLR